MAYRNIASSVASIISGGIAGYVLEIYKAPMSYAYLFLVSSLIMAIGFFVFSTIDEPVKENISKKEKNFAQFLNNALKILKSDKELQLQITAIFLSFCYLLSMPFVILHANSSIELSGWMLGGFISIQMLGSIFGSFFFWRKISDYEKMLSYSFVFMIFAFILAILASNVYIYGLIFFLFGISLDGFSISGMNLIFEIAPEEKRPVYTALQTNLSSLGLFFPILGGYLLKMFDNYDMVYIITICLLVMGLLISLKIGIRRHRMTSL